ncbi:MAG: TIR domain-containing protein [Anaerolineales bacterium]
MEHLFLSYSHKDADFIEELIPQLKAEGFSPWTDAESIAPGTPWRHSIDKAIQESFAVLVLMTPAARASEYVTYEWAYAMGIGITVIPVMLEKTDLHPKLEELQYVDLTRGRKRPIQRLLVRLAELRVEHWIKRLDEPRFEDRNRAIRRLVELDSDAAVSKLIELMWDDPSEKAVRPHAADALRVLGTPEALDAVARWEDEHAR